MNCGTFTRRIKSNKSMLLTALHLSPVAGTSRRCSWRKLRMASLRGRVSAASSAVLNVRSALISAPAKRTEIRNRGRLLIRTREEDDQPETKFQGSVPPSSRSRASSLSFAVSAAIWPAMPSRSAIACKALRQSAGFARSDQTAFLNDSGDPVGQHEDEPQDGKPAHAAFRLGQR